MDHITVTDHDHTTTATYDTNTRMQTKFDFFFTSAATE